MTKSNSNHPKSFEISGDPTQDEVMMECAMKIAQHLERNIIRHREAPAMAHKLVGMNKYIHANYINKLHCRD